MTEDDARNWIVERFGAVAGERVGAFLEMVVEENARQNLIAPSTVATIWARHAVDSAQLLKFDRAGLWVDIGTGGGFPGMVVALLRQDPVLMIEPRGRRATFLQGCIDELGLEHAEAIASKVEKVSGRCAAVVSARAVASIPVLIDSARHLCSARSRWVLPRGRSGHDEVAALPPTWQGMFHVEQSVVGGDSTIAILDGVSIR